MKKTKTKADLEAENNELRSNIERLENKLSDEQSKARSFEQESRSNLRNSQVMEARIKALQFVIEASLEVIHEVPLEPPGPVYDGYGALMKDDERVSEHARLLRHLHKLTTDQVPF